MITPEGSLIQKRTADNTTLPPSAQAFYDWYLSNEKDRQRRQESIALTDMDNFKDLYPESEINNDKNEVRNLRNKVNQKDFTQYAEIAEHITRTFATDNLWFGEDSVITETLEYDDRKNGTDFVIEWEDPKTSARTGVLAIDVTVTNRRDVLVNKLMKTKQSLEDGTLTNIKYFNSGLNGDNEHLHLTPRVIIAFDKNNLDSLCKELIVYTENTNSYNKVKNPYMSLFVLKTSEIQLNKQLTYLKDLGISRGNPQKYEAAENAVQQTLDLLSKELEQKEKSLSKENLQQAYVLLEKLTFPDVF